MLTLSICGARTTIGVTHRYVTHTPDSAGVCSGSLVLFPYRIVLSCLSVFDYPNFTVGQYLAQSTP